MMGNEMEMILKYNLHFIYFGKKNDDLRQNLFLEVKKPEIKETKGTFIPPAFKSSYWGPFSGLKSQDLIKISRTFPYGLFRKPGLYPYPAKHDN